MPWPVGGPARSSPWRSGCSSGWWRCAGSPTRWGWRRPSASWSSTARWPPCRWEAGRVTSGSRWRCAGRRAGPGVAGSAAVARAGNRSRCWRGMSLLRSGWRDMGVVHDRRARTLTAALAVRGASFALLGADEQDRRVGAWASVLASLAREGSPVRRVQWVASSFPDDGEGVRSYLAAAAASDGGRGVHGVLRVAARRHGLATPGPTTWSWPSRCG